MAEVDVAELVHEVEEVVDAIGTVLAFADKYDNLLPAPVQTALKDVENAVSFVKSILDQLE